MAKLVQAACVAALLAAAPAMAQTDTQPADTGTNNAVNAPGTSAAGSPTAPPDRMGTGAMHHHRHAMGAMHARNDMAGHATADQLNDQSYQAAQRGEAFSAGTMSGGSMAPVGSGMAPADAAGTGGGASGK